jgi:hypothetical protein
MTKSLNILILFALVFSFILFYLYLDETLSSGIFKHQVSTLFITIDTNKKTSSTVVNIFNEILNTFTSLIHLILYESLYDNRVQLYFSDPPPHTFRSSTLLKLNVKVQCFEDCLYLLDGRFNQLHTLYVDFIEICDPEKIENQVRFTR